MQTNIKWQTFRQRVYINRLIMYDVWCHYSICIFYTMLRRPFRRWTNLWINLPIKVNDILSSYLKIYTNWSLWLGTAKLRFRFFNLFRNILYLITKWYSSSLQWRHNGRDGVSNHQPHDCLLNRLFRRRSKKTSKLRVTGPCEGNSPVTGKFPAQRASNAEMPPSNKVIMQAGASGLVYQPRPVCRTWELVRSLAIVTRIF